MAGNAISILFDVKGGGSIGGESGRLIKSQLDNLASQIRLQINIDEGYFQQQVSQLKSTLESQLGNIKISVDASGATSMSQGAVPDGGAGGAAANQKATAYANLERQLEAVASAEDRVRRTASGNAIEHEKAKHKANELAAAYAGTRREAMANGQITEEQARALDVYAASLDRAIQEEQQRASSPATDKQIRENERLEMSYAKLQRKAASLYTDGGLNKLVDRNPKAKQLVDDFNDQVKHAYNGLDDNDIAGKQAKVRELNTEFERTQTKLKGMQKEANTLGNQMRDTFTSKVLQTFAYAIIGLATRAMQQLYQNVVKLDSAVTDLQIASGMAREEVEALMDSYSELAKEIGATTAEVAESADTWLRQGYSIEEANTLIQASMMLSKLGQIESAEAAKALTSAMKGYKLEVADATGIVDKFTAVDMEAAVSAGDIATAMAETAASAEIAGVSMNKLIGYIATAAEVTQDGAESVGTFYKTLFARMNKVAAGDFVDEETGEDLNDVEIVLSELGIALRDTNGLFRNSADVLDDVAEKWENFDNVQQHAIATAFAGTRQQEKFLVLMENYGTAMEYAETATNSAGTAQEKYADAYLSGIEAATNSLTAAWEDFSRSLLDSGLVVVFFNILQVIATVLSEILSFGDSIIVTFGITGAAVALFSLLLKKALGDAELSWASFEAAITSGAVKVGAALKAMVQNPHTYIILLIGLFAQFANELPPAAQIIVGAILAIGTGVAIACKVANGAIWAFMSSNIVGWIMLAITAIGLGIASIVKGLHTFANASNIAKEEAIKASKEAKEAWEEASADVDAISNKIEELANRLQELMKLSNSGTITLVELEEKNRLEETITLLEAEKKLLEDIQIEKQRLAQEAAADAILKIKDSSDNIRAYNEFRWSAPSQREINAMREAGLPISSSVLMGNGLGVYTFYKQSLQSEIKEILSRWNDPATTSDEKNTVLDFFDSIKEHSDTLTYYRGENLAEWQKSVNSAYDYYYEIMHAINLGMGEYEDVWKSIMAMDRFSGIEDILKGMANDGIVTTDSLRSLYSSNQEFKSLVDYLEKIGMFSWSDISSVSALVNQINSMGDAAHALVEVPFLTILKEVEGRFDALSSALESVAENGIIAADSIADLIKEYPELLKYFEMTDQGYILNSEYSDMNNYDILQGFATEYLQKYVNTLANCEEGSANWEIAQKSLNNAIATMATLLRTEAIAEATKAYEEQKESLEKSLDKHKELIDIRKELLATYKEELDYKEELAKKEKSVADLQTQLSLARLDTSASGRARARELEAELSDAQKELDDFTLEHAIETVTKQLDSETQEYEAFIKEQIDRIETAIKEISSTVVVNIEIPDPTPAQPSPPPIEDQNNRDYTGRLTLQEERMHGLETHHAGGFVGGQALLKDNEVFSKLLEGELVSTPSQISRFMRETFPRIIQSAENGSGGVFYNAPLLAIQCDTISEETMPIFKKVVDQAVKKIKSEMDDAFVRTGYRKGVNKFST